MQNAVVLRCGIAIDALKQRALPLERFFVCVEIRVFRGREWLEGRGDCFRLVAAARLRRRAMFKVPQQRFHRSVPQETGLPLEPVTWREETCETSGNGGFQRV